MYIVHSTSTSLQSSNSWRYSSTLVQSHGKSGTWWIYRHPHFSLNIFEFLVIYQERCFFSSVDWVVYKEILRVFVFKLHYFGIIHLDPGIWESFGEIGCKLENGYILHCSSAPRTALLSVWKDGDPFSAWSLVFQDNGGTGIVHDPPL